MSEPVIPCPTCPEGWRPLDKEHCADCYEGQIERLRTEIERRNFIRAMSGPDAYDKAEIWHKQATELADEADRLRSALTAIYEWYDRDGSVGGASSVFEENRPALSQADRGVTDK
jgi:hypothetical protein